MDTSTSFWPAAVPTPLMGRVHRFFPRPEVVRMESGRHRKRRIYERTVELIDVTWNFTADEYQTFKTFFEETLQNGTLSFGMITLEWTVHGLGEVPTENTRELAFWGNYSFSKSDHLFSVAATLEVISVESGAAWGIHHTRTITEALTLGDGIERSVGNGGEDTGVDDSWTRTISEELEPFAGVVGSLGDSIVPDDNPQKELNGWIYRPSRGVSAYLSPQWKAYEPIGTIILEQTRIYAAIENLPWAYYDMHWNKWFNLTGDYFVYRKQLGPFDYDVMLRVDYDNVYSRPIPRASNHAETWFYFYNGDPGWRYNVPPEGVSIQTDRPRVRRKLDHVQGLDIHGNSIFETKRYDQWHISSDPGGSQVITDITNNASGSTTDHFEFQLDQGEFLWAVIIHSIGGVQRPYLRSYWEFVFSTTPV